MSEKEGTQKLSPIRYPSLSKNMSERPQKRDQKWVQQGQSCQPKAMPQEVITYMLMKQKFDKLYKNIERITLKEDQIVAKRERQTYSESPSASIKAIHLSSDRKTDPEICKIRTSHLYPKLSLPQQSLEINTLSESEYTNRGKSLTPAANKQQQQQLQVMRKSHYKKKFQENNLKSKMSNNIKDYLSVERISIREMEESLLYQKSKLANQQRLSNLLGFKGDSSEKVENYRSVELNVEAAKPEAKPKNIIVRRPSKFKPPFQLYNYRDFMWQVAYSNGLIVEPVEEYETKVKIYIGPGNNSNLIKGIMRRRPWWTLTNDAKEATFVWTQIKVQSLFGMQKKGQRLPVIIDCEEDNPLLNTSNQNKTKLVLLNSLEQLKWESYWRLNIDRERKIKENFKARTSIFKLSETPLSKIRSEFKIHNHFVNNFIIGNKKALFSTMSEYYSKLNQNVFDFLPLTFHIKKGLEDDEYLKFLQHFYVHNKAAKNDPDCINKFNAWIVKPGQNTNRGNGIIVCLDLNEIKAILKRQEKHKDGTLKTYILQKYIERPLLYKKRKFDLRHYMMLNCSNGRMKGYWYKQGYVRTTSTEYTLKIGSGSVHLTNDAVQKNLPDYGKFQKGNKIYYQQLDQFIKKQDPEFDFFKIIYPKMKKIATDVIHASALNIDPERRINNFEIFGLDFMIDSNYDVWLIEVNTNPCLETTCPVLNKIIPKFIENTFQICLDPVLPAPLGFKPKYQQYYENLKDENAYELVFDERVDGVQSIGESIVAVGVDEEDDVFDDDGEDFDEAL